MDNSKFDWKSLRNWVDDTKQWPPITNEKISDYFVSAFASDDQRVEAFKSMLAYNYVDSGHVSTVFSCEAGKDLVAVKCEVTRSQSLNAKPCQAFVLLKSEGEIITAACDCMAGQARTCSHVAAILFKMAAAAAKGLIGSACTDQDKTWNRGTKRNIFPSPINEIVWKKPRRNATPCQTITDIPRTHHPTFSFDSKEDLLDFIHSSPTSNLWKIKGTTCNNILEGRVTPDHTNHDPSLPCDPCKEHFQLLINWSQESLSNLEKVTRQSCHLPIAKEIWTQARKVRLTASSKVPKKSSTNPIKFLRQHLFPTFFGNTATREGQRREVKVKPILESQLRIQIQECGIIVSDTYPWLSATPDGLIGTDTVLEIKSPQVQSFLKLFETAKKHDLEFDEDLNPRLVIEGPNRYYQQIQLQMFCSDRPKGIFVFYIEEEETIIHFSVDYDSNYVTQLINLWEHFYFAHMLPFITDIYFGDQINLSQLLDSSKKK